MCTFIRLQRKCLIHRRYFDRKRYFCFCFCFDCVHYFYSNNYSKQKKTHLKIKKCTGIYCFYVQINLFLDYKLCHRRTTGNCDFYFFSFHNLITHAFTVVFELYTIFDFVQVQVFDCSPQNVIEV